MHRYLLFAALILGVPALARFPDWDCLRLLLACAVNPQSDVELLVLRDLIEEGALDRRGNPQSGKAALVPVVIELDRLHRTQPLNLTAIEETKKELAKILGGKPLNRSTMIHIEVPFGGISPFGAWSADIPWRIQKNSPLPRIRFSDGGYLMVKGDQIVENENFIRLPEGEISLRESLAGKPWYETRRIGKGVWMNKYPVTQLQFTLRTRRNPATTLTGPFLHISGHPVDVHRPAELTLGAAEDFIELESTDFPPSLNGSTRRGPPQ